MQRVLLVSTAAAACCWLAIGCSESNVREGSTPDGSIAGGDPDGSIVGSDPDSSTATADGGVPTSGAPAYCSEPNQEPAVQWDGWIEAFMFPSGSDRVRVAIGADGAGGWTGFLLIGEGPNVDPTPSGADDCNFLCTPLNLYSSPMELMEGFRYSLGAVTYTESRLRFDVSPYELFAAWCSVQTPVPLEPGSDAYDCVPNTGFRTEPSGCYLTPAGEPEIPVPCCKLSLCQHVCDCTASGCSATTYPATFDLFIEGTFASGTTPFGTAHLERR